MLQINPTLNGGDFFTANKRALKEKLWTPAIRRLIKMTTYCFLVLYLLLADK